jgi:hypothetical protein
MCQILVLAGVIELIISRFFSVSRWISDATVIVFSTYPKLPIPAVDVASLNNLQIEKDDIIS